MKKQIVLLLILLVLSSAMSLSSHNDKKQKEIKEKHKQVVQIGHVHADGFDWPSASSLERNKVIPVVFDEEFDEVPKVQVSIALFDNFVQRNGRVSVYTKDITTTGFNLVIATWSDSVLNQATASWIAVGY